MKKLADKETVAARMAVCSTCEMFDSARNRCKKCRCWMNAKIKLAATKCPLGKWGRESLRTKNQ